MRYVLHYGFFSLVVFSIVSNVFYMKMRHFSEIADSVARIDTIAQEPQMMINRTRTLQTKLRERIPRARILNRKSLKKSTSFSSCLLVRDDNDILNEWIAYHYFTLKLRYLIVAVDPLSETSPSDVLDKWKDRMVIVLWNDTTYMPKDFLAQGVPPLEFQFNETTLQGKFDKSFTDHELIEISNHRYRQRVFLTECIKALKSIGRTWTIHIDTDEFVTVNKILRKRNPENYVDIPSIETPGSIMTFLKDVTVFDPERVSYPCISMMRVLFGSIETSEERLQQGIGQLGINASKFETLRWNYHALPHNRSQHGYGKVILDISRISLRNLYTDNGVIFSIHRPFPRICQSFESQQFNYYREFPLSVNHYLGSWERYSSRNDKRRSFQSYKKKADLHGGLDEGTKPWIRGFINFVGHEDAAKLLGEDYLASNFAEKNKISYANRGNNVFQTIKGRKALH